MPFVNIKLASAAGDGASVEQKAEIISGVTALLVNVLGKNPETVHVVIEELDLHSWGVGGMSVAERKNAAAKKDVGRS